MNVLRIGLLVLVAAGGLAVVLSRNPLKQALMVGIYGLLLALLFSAFQDPDVALSQIVVSSVGLPVMILLALAKMRRHEQPARDDAEDDRG